MKVGLLGGGVIGGGWAARFLLNGHDAVLYDPDPETPRKVEEMLENARRAYSRLTYAPLPPEGTLTFAATPGEAAGGVGFIQESAPERIELKRELLGAASRVAPPDVVIASSTSGLLPSVLREGMTHPERLTVGHPFNPVYLLPLVELCGSPETVERASAFYQSVGMHPLVVRQEIDGFIAGRLLEALRREALWLVNNGVATVEEVDEAIRFGPGLLWSSMGTLLVHRSTGDRSVRELERERDDALVAVLQALRGNRVGAGETLADYERTLLERSSSQEQPDKLRWETSVLPEWVDYNGHATESSYLLMTSHAADALLGAIGIDADYLRSGGSYYTVETHICHLDEAKAGDRLVVTTQALGADEKRIHIFVRIMRGETLLATTEQMLLHVDTNAGRAVPASAEVLARVQELVDAHSALPWPERAGRRIGLPAAGR